MGPSRGEQAQGESVVAQPDAVGRDEAATALDLATHKAKFHLDRLVDDGLLSTEFRRLSGRTGPGAGRPSKLYRRAETAFDVSLPPRRYDLVGAILAAGVERTAAGENLDAALADTARAEGLALGSGAATGTADLHRVAEVLASQGYEPRVDDAAVVLANCPFDDLAQRHTDLVCGLNVAFVQGVTDGVGCAGARALLEPDAGRCCVTVRA